MGCHTRGTQEKEGEVMPTPEEAATAALAYAIWDSENSTKMNPACIDEHLERARAILYWLKVHGHAVTPEAKS